MSEYTANAPQTVTAGQNVLLTETPIRCNRGFVCHRDGSGIITLRGITNQCRARYRVSADGNIAVAAGGTAGAISVSLAITGEPLNSATAIVTPRRCGRPLQRPRRGDYRRAQRVLPDHCAGKHQHTGDHSPECQRNC